MGDHEAQLGNIFVGWSYLKILAAVRVVQMGCGGGFSALPACAHHIFLIEACIDVCGCRVGLEVRVF